MNYTDNICYHPRRKFSTKSNTREHEVNSDQAMRQLVNPTTWSTVINEWVNVKLHNATVNYCFNYFGDSIKVDKLRHAINLLSSCLPWPNSR